MFLAVKVLRINDSLREGWLDGKKKWIVGCRKMDGRNGWLDVEIDRLDVGKWMEEMYEWM